jgi:hypothetical protein
MFAKYQPVAFPLDATPKKIFATHDAVGIVTEDNKIYFLNDRNFVSDCDFQNKEVLLS